MDDSPPTPPPPQPDSQPPMPPDYPAGQTLPPPQPPSGPFSAEEKQMAMWCHLSGLATFLIPLGNIVVPLVLWTTKRDTMPFVEKEGRESLNFEISITIYYIVSIILIWACVGIVLVFALMIFHIVFVVLAAVEASKGNSYRYPLCIRFIN
jgi:uncharacterized Tic20 family protein